MKVRELMMKAAVFCGPNLGAAAALMWDNECVTRPPCERRPGTVHGSSQMRFGD